MTGTFAARIRERLEAARALFPEDADRYRLPAPCPPEVVEARERAWGVQLPEDYRAYLLEVGDGGPGPDQGLAPFAEWAPAHLPSPNLPDDAHPCDGCLFLSDPGGGHFLVIGGPRAGEVWLDTTADGEGGALQVVAPSFGAWYEQWLDEVVAYGVVGVARAGLRDGTRSARLDPIVRRHEGLVVAGTDEASVAARAVVDAYLGRRAEADLRLRDADAADLVGPNLRAAGRQVYREAYLDAESDAPDAIRRAASHPLAAVREAAARNPNASAALLDLLAADPRPSVAGAVADHPSAPASALARLVESTPDSAAGFLVREALARHPATPAPHLPTLAAADPWLARAVAGRPDAPALDVLARSDLPCVRHRVALHPAASASALDLLANDLDPIVRMAIAAREDLLPDRIERLAGDADPRVRAMIAWRPDLPIALQLRLADDPAREVVFALGETARAPEVRARIEQRPEYVPSDRPVRLFGCWPLGSWDGNRLRCFRLDATSREVFDAGCFSHPSFPVVLMEPYVERQYGMGGYAMADHPWLSPAMFERLATHPYGYTRLKIAGRPDTPPELLARLAVDPWADVRARVAARS